MGYKFVSFFTSIILFFSSLFGGSYCAPARRLNIERLDKKITSSQCTRIEKGTLMGSIVTVNQNGKCVFNKTYGKSSVNGGEMKADATFRIASMTKPVTAAAMLIAYDMGILDIYADVSDYLPQFKEMYIKKTDTSGNDVKDGAGRLVKGEKAQNSIKVYQTVSHVTGLQEVNADFNAYESFSLRDAVDNIASQPLNFEPGTEQSYCTSSFDIPARIIEMKTGMEYEDFLDKYIFSRLGMTDTTFSPGPDRWGRMVAVHGRNDDGTMFDAPTVPGCVFSNFPVSYCAAGAGLISTASDYMKFAEMLQNNGRAPDGTAVLSEKSVKLMQTPIPEMKNGIMGGSTQWGLGVRVIVNNTNTLPKGAFGWSGAYGTHFWIDPANKITVVYMKNSCYDGGAGAETASELERDVMKSVTVRKLK